MSVSAANRAHLVLVGATGMVGGYAFTMHLIIPPSNV